MIELNNNIENEKEFTLKCDCGHGAIRITYWTEDKHTKHSIYFLDYYEMVFYTSQNGIFKTIWNRIKLATSILMGKEFNLYELVLYADQFKEFLNFVNKNTKSDIENNIENT